MKLTVAEGSSNYTAQIVRLPPIQDVKGLDNLGRVTIFGSDALIGKDSDPNELHVFFPAECQLSVDFLHNNSLYRHENLNTDPTKKGFFEDNSRVKSIKFKGVISTCFVTPVSSLSYLGNLTFKVGQEFTDIDGAEICRKYVRKFNKGSGVKEPRILDQLVDSRMAPEHPDTAQLFRNLDKLTLSDYVAVTYKLHGCVSAVTKIETLEFGTQYIKTIVDNKLKCHVKSFDLDTQEIIYSPIEDFFFKENDGEWFELELENGQKLEITGNNPIWLPEENCYKMIKELTGQEKVLIM